METNMKYEVNVEKYECMQKNMKYTYICRNKIKSFCQLTGYRRFLSYGDFLQSENDAVLF